ncbi:putative endoplasmic reticulum membrane protein C16E8.02 [Vitis vinifera]|uniref:Putative endoplasmic reticulum membrane protein C16E8.02 n=1 Tax=Vitis vinifera TaxID=29760 RepID=A0A438FDZ0_VITVI|nr:putative endoplasmic reticulum membrane protein C16E8.02 [Vitis vinifera]
MGKMGLFDLERHFAFYGAYHSDPVNVFLHMLLCGLSSSRLLFSSTSRLLSSFCPKSGCSHLAGCLAALLCFSCWVGSSFLLVILVFSGLEVVLASQLFCWTGQFIGHGVFEKRAPALLDNLAQAFIMAPFFVLLEALQTTIGYEPYPGFSKNVKEKIGADIKEWHDKKQKKIS